MKMHHSTPSPTVAQQPGVSHEPTATSADGMDTLIFRQQPVHARVALGKEKDRKPIDPPPIVQLKVDRVKDPHQNFLQSPYLMAVCHLVPAKESIKEEGKDEKKADKKGDKKVVANPLSGSMVSSLHKLKDVNNEDGGFFIFGDLSVKVEGQYRLHITLWDRAMEDLLDSQGSCIPRLNIVSSVFTVHSQKTFPGMMESTFLTRSFSEQGVRLRLRKDSRTILTRKRNSEYAQRSRDHSTYDNPQQTTQEQARRPAPTSRGSLNSSSNGDLDPGFIESSYPASSYPNVTTANNTYTPGGYQTSGYSTSSYPAAAAAPAYPPSSYPGNTYTGTNYATSTSPYQPYPPSTYPDFQHQPIANGFQGGYHPQDLRSFKRKRTE